jgi:hypothetical protein
MHKTFKEARFEDRKKESNRRVLPHVLTFPGKKESENK